ncbi:HMG-box domain-containing protein [Xanthomonas graminis]|uniref:hypothetical protein n=1 Tax=Xanthomonas graminis TaxID=3390026 RepID=UPI001F3C1659|nr:hypothetical protein [Xanthomonas translucens]UKE73463.1 hypothetical protein KFS85_00330 [Xanthomonas translucens pv. phleipratensis]
MPRFGRFLGIGSSSGSSSSRRAENESERRNAQRETPAASADPRLAGLTSRPAPASPPRALSSVEQLSHSDIHRNIRPNLVTIRDQCQHIPELHRTYQRADLALGHADRRLNNDFTAMPRDDLARELEKCKKEFERYTETQYQPVKASDRYAQKTPTLPGSDAQISQDVMQTAMNMLFGFHTMVNPIKMDEWHKSEVGKILVAISKNEQVSHAAVYEAYQHKDNPRALIEALVAHVDR